MIRPVDQTIMVHRMHISEKETVYRPAQKLQSLRLRRDLETEKKTRSKVSKRRGQDPKRGQSDENKDQAAIARSSTIRRRKKRVSNGRVIGGKERERFAALADHCTPSLGNSVKVCVDELAPTPAARWGCVSSLQYLLYSDSVPKRPQYGLDFHSLSSLACSLVS
ncbi:hypothetical protein HUJ04_001679 [Dendroctonus ponderosae]|nr:hypothetical protein HUJ04_001679 [Dendroctonus ponderosae]